MSVSLIGFDDTGRLSAGIAPDFNPNPVVCHSNPLPPTIPSQRALRLRPRQRAQRMSKRQLVAIWIGHMKISLAPKTRLAGNSAAGGVLAKDNSERRPKSSKTRTFSAVPLPVQQFHTVMPTANRGTRDHLGADRLSHKSSGTHHVGHHAVV